MNIVRNEKDPMGAIDVPADRLRGAQARRSLEHFHISTEKTSTLLIHALALTKRAATKVNEDLGLLSEEKTSATRQAVGKVLIGQHDDEFPLAIWRTGFGTRSDMSMSEALANRTNELLGGVRGMERKVYPNGDTNKSQSSDDVFPATMYVAALLALRKQFVPQLRTLIQTLSEKSRAFADIVRIGRTHLQDVTPLALGQEIPGQVAVLEHNFKHVEYSLPHVVELALGGIAVGIGLNTYPGYTRHVVDKLVVITCTPFITAPNKFEALATCDALIQAYDTLKGSATSLVKIANDVCWLASGPRYGIGEISIPKNESSSPIMPRKVNPTQCEALTMLHCQVMGDDMATNMGGASGNFELSAFRPMVIRSFLQSVRLLVDGMESSNKHCAVGIESDRERANQLFNELLILVTTLNTHTGYDKVAEVTKKAHKEGLTLKAAALVLRYLSKTESDSQVRLEQMAGSMKTGH